MTRHAIVIALVFAGLVAAGPSMAATVKITSTYNRDQLRTACSNAGGTFEASLAGWNCSKPCTVDGRQGTCSVDCNANGVCTGKTPRALGGLSRRLVDILAAGQIAQ